MLNHLVLAKICEQPQTGYSLCKEIEHSTGKKPSFGSIYPILEKLSKEDLVTVRKQGRKKIYTATQKGKAAISGMRDQKQQMIDALISHHKAFCEVAKLDPKPMVAFFERIKKGEQPLGQISHNAMRLRNIIVAMANDGKTKQHAKDINKILEDTIKKLERL